MAKAKKSQRGFRHVRKPYCKGEKGTLPIRADKGSAGYDFFANESYILAPNQTHVFWTNIKAYMLDDEVLLLYVRSSMGIKKGARLANGTGVIDSTYYNNPSNDGNIGIAIQNVGKKPLVIKAGDRIAQGVFTKFLVADNDAVLKETRDGGIGSSDE